MGTIQLKRYKIKPGTWDKFISTLREIVVMRRKHGFNVLFALHDPETNWFTWAIDHQGDFDAAAKAYYLDPDRVALDHVVDYVSDYEIVKVNAISLP